MWGSFENVALCTNTFSEDGIVKNCTSVINENYLCDNKKLYVCGVSSNTPDWATSVTDDQFEVLGKRCNPFNNKWTVPVQVSSCQVINNPGIYVLTRSITTGSSFTSCFSITADAVIFDGNGQSIDGFYTIRTKSVTSPTNAIENNVGKSLIRDFQDIRGFYYGVYDKGSAKILNSRMSNNKYGVLINSGTQVLNSQIISNNFGILTSLVYTNCNLKTTRLNLNGTIISSSNECDFATGLSCGQSAYAPNPRAPFSFGCI